MHLREVHLLQGHYMNAFGTLRDMVEARDWLAARAHKAGVA